MQLVRTGSTLQTNLSAPSAEVCSAYGKSIRFITLPDQASIHLGEFVNQDMPALWLGN